MNPKEINVLEGGHEPIPFENCGRELSRDFIKNREDRFGQINVLYGKEFLDEDLDSVGMDNVHR